MDVHFSSAWDHFSEGCATVTGYPWVQGVLPAAPGPHIPPAPSPNTGEGSREKAPGYQESLHFSLPAFRQTSSSRIMCCRPLVQKEAGLQMCRNQGPAGLLLGRCDMQLFTSFYIPMPRAGLQLMTWRCYGLMMSPPN